jgi:hypothetical protein
MAITSLNQMLAAIKSHHGADEALRAEAMMEAEDLAALRWEFGAKALDARELEEATEIGVVLDPAPDPRPLRGTV